MKKSFMRIMSMFLILSMICGIMPSISAASTETKTLFAAGAPSPISVDGVLTENIWSLDFASFVHESGSNTARAGCLWDKDRLYVAVDVDDDSVVEGTVWNADTVNLFIDGESVKGAYSPNEKSVGLYAFAFEGDIRTGNNNAGNLKTDGIEYSFSKRDGGYCFEASIPWTSLGITPSIGKVMGVTVNIDNIDKGSGISTSYFNTQMTGGDTKNSANWAQVTLGAEGTEMQRQFLDNCDTDNSWTNVYGSPNENIFIADSTFTGNNGKKAAEGQLLAFAADNAEGTYRHINYTRDDFKLGNGGWRFRFDADFKDVPTINKNFYWRGLYFKLCDNGREFRVAFNRDPVDGKIYANTYKTGRGDKELARALIDAEGMHSYAFDYDGGELVTMTVDGVITAIFKSPFNAEEGTVLEMGTGTWSEDGDYKSGTCEVYLDNIGIDTYDAKQKKIEVRAGNIPALLKGKSQTVTVSANVGGTPIAFSSNITMTAISQNPNIATAKLVSNIDNKKMNLTVNAVEAGQTSIDLNLTSEGVTRTISVPITVTAAPSLNYNLMKLWESSYNIGTNIKTITSFAQTTMGSPEEINKAQGEYTDPWIYYDSASTSNFRFTDNTYACMFDGNVGSWLSLKIRVPNEAVYRAISYSSFWNYGSIMRIYLAPENAQNPRADEYAIGTIDSYKNPASWNEKVPLQIVKLNKADYILTYEIIGQNFSSSGLRFPVHGFLLAPPDATELYLRTDPIHPIAQDEESVIPLFAKINGEAVSLSGASALTAKCEDEQIATVKIGHDGDKTNLIVQGIKTGNTTISVAATVNGISSNVDIPIRVALGSELRQVTMTIDKPSLAVGESTKAHASATLMDGTVPNTNSIKTYFESSDAKIATVDSDGVITARAAGNVNIIAYVEKDKIVKTTTLPITVGGVSPLECVSLQGPGALSVGGTYQLQLKGTLKNGYTADLSNAKITYNISQDEQQGTISVSETGKVTANKLGSASVQAEVTMDGTIVKSTAILINVRDGKPIDLTYDFRENQTLTPQNATIASHGWEINREKTSGAIYENGINFGKCGLEFELQTACTPREADVAIDVSIDRAGFYSFEVSGGQFTSGAVAAVYADQNYLGTYEFYGEETRIGKTERLNSVYLDQGRHTIALRRINSKGGTRMYLSAITLRAVDKLPDFAQISASASKNTMSVGQSAKLDISVMMENGVPFQFGNLINGEQDSMNDLEIESRTQGAFTIEANGIITAQKPGDGFIDIIAKINGIEHRTSVLITVDNDTIKELSLGMGGALTAGTKKKIDIVAKTGSGRELDLSDLTLSLESSDESVVQIDGLMARGIGIGKAKITANATLGGIDTELVQKANVTAKSQDESIATCEIKDDLQTGRKLLAVTGHKTGTTTILLRAEQDGKSVVFTANVKVVSNAEEENNDYIYNFSQDFSKNNTVGNPTNQKNMPWVWNTVSDGANTEVTYNGSYAFFGNSTNRFESDGNPEYFKMDIEVPRDGIYDTSVLCGHGDYCAVANIYLAPGDVGVTASSEYLMGTVDTSPDSGKVGDTITKLKTVELKKGTYSLTFAMDRHSGYYFQLGNFKISRVGGNEDNIAGAPLAVEVEVDKTESMPLHAKLGGVTVSNVLDVTVENAAFEGIEVTSDTTIMKPNGKAVQLKVTGRDGTGKVIGLEGAEITYKSSDNEIIWVGETGVAIPFKPGTVTVDVTATMGGITHSAKILLTVSTGKTESTYYTPERVAAARENTQKYEWARSNRDSAVKNAEQYLNKEDYLWNMVTTQELPRGITVGYRFDPEAYTCRYCGTDLRQQFGRYSWLADPMKTPFKIQCPACRRKFPSNDFESFYNLGIDEYGKWCYELAKQKNAELVANGQDGYLINILYPEMDEKLGVKNWGVDDGWGYKTGRTYEGGVEEVHTYIGYYNHFSLWDAGTIYKALDTLKEAYVYTGDIRYGRVGAILIDRVADVYPEMFTAPSFPKFANSDSSQPNGKILGSIWECGLAKRLAINYDAFYPAMEDSQVIRFLSQKAERYKMDNKKQTANNIRKNCEDGLLREIYKGCKTADINGNFGMHQSALTAAAVVLDNMPETKEMIDWVFRSGGYYSKKTVTGGNVLAQMIETINRDGTGNEASPGYNVGWLENLMTVAEVLQGYPNYSEADLFKNPKFNKMFVAYMPSTLCRRATPQIGDYSCTAGLGFPADLDPLILGFQNTKDVRIAQYIYLINGNSTKGLHGNVFTKNPEEIQGEIQKIIDTNGEYDLDQSTQMAAYGLTVLRGGHYVKSVSNTPEADTQRDFWMYYGTGNVHGHPDALNLGMEAFGLNFAPELGYPETADGNDNYMNWGNSTVSHNTVQVNDKKQNRIYINGDPLHFDDSGRVKLMDVSAPTVYSECDIYRRTIVMVEASDDVSYGVDLFRVKGGNEHLYSFHAASDVIESTEGISLVSQPIGSYAGPNVPFGENAQFSNGYNYLKNVQKAKYPSTGTFSVDFKIEDFRKTLPTERDLHLRMTMLNDFDLSEVSIVDGVPPQVSNNPKSLKFVLARNSGKNLDSLFTTVFEPYDGERYIASMEQVPITRTGGSVETARDKAKAIKVTLKNGRVDYIVYTTNNMVEYRVDDMFNFRGFVGVYTMKDGVPVYSYLNDGDIIGDSKGTAAYTGIISDFTRDMSAENSITVNFDDAIDVSKLAGKSIYVENDKTENGVYQILNATSKDGKAVTLHIGDTTLIRSCKDPNDLNGGFIYNIQPGQTFRIPLPAVNDSTPIFADQELSQRTDANSELRIHVNATSPMGRKLTYTGVSLPRGASFDTMTNTFIWRPDIHQMGTHYVAIKADDGYLSSVQRFEIKVTGIAGGQDKPVLEVKPNPGGSGAKPPINHPQPSTPEKSEKDFTVKVDKALTAETTLGSVTFPKGSISEDGKGKLTITKDGDKLDVNATVGGKTIQPEAPVKVDIHYKPADTMTDSNCIIVKDPSGSIIPSGKFENGKVTFYAQELGQFTIAYNPKAFKDLQNYQWASDAICRLAARGIINGTSAMTYNPAMNITRADFATLIVRTFGFTADKPERFSDVPENAYYAREVGIAKALGIVGGVSDTSFAPTAQISREDMMLIVARAADNAGLKLAGKTSINFTDTDSVSSYAKNAVDTLTASGIIIGANEKVNPHGKTTRAEVAVILDRLVFIAR